MKLIDNTILYSFQGKILDKFYLYDTEGVTEVLEMFCRTYANEGFVLQTDILQQFFINITFLASKHVQYQYNDGIIEKIKSCHSIYMLKSVVEDYLKSLIIFQQKKLDEVTHQAIDKVKAYIGQHYTENISLEQIADQMHFNPNYMGHLFKQKYGIGFKEYIISMRINKAKQLLSKTNLKVYEVAEKSGYCDVPYFIKIFKKETGISPNKFRIG
jgi:YesN/AraC family two-component response regulator